ncbi:prepilin-type N-terminal cleavage/methylation domain-containing protein [Candidatus Saccharibacteria bacterium]|nr:prepilin-type N-terminal cleavage/methylation domain-containing protein [Candidatus Saccharibacteria bacterium]
MNIHTSARRSRRYGFTIVELLIVIIVIAILALIAISSLRGAQERASDAQTLSFTESYRKALTAYATERGIYPPNIPSCLGSGYPDLDGDGTPGQCIAWNVAPKAPLLSEKPFVINELAQYFGSNPGAPSPRPYYFGNYAVAGVAIDNMGAAGTVTLNGVNYDWFLWYTLSKQATTCPIGPVVKYSERPNLTTYDHTPSEVLDNGIRCWVPLTPPDRL